MVFHDGYREIYNLAYLNSSPDRRDLFGSNVEIAQAEEHHEFVRAALSLQDRDMSKAAPGDVRHKFRWIYLAFQERIYSGLLSLIGAGGEKYVNYVRYSHDAAWITVGFLFSFMVVSWHRGSYEFPVFYGLAFAYFSLVCLTSTSPRMFDLHTITETGLVSAGIYFAFRRHLLFFMICLVIAVANRESAVAFGLIYLIVNWPRREVWLPVLSAPVLLLLFNYDLLAQPEMRDPFTYLFPGEAGYVNFMNLHKVPLVTVLFSVCKILIVISPMLLILTAGYRNDVTQQLKYVFLLYLVIVLFGTYIGNIFPFTILVPVIVMSGTIVVMGLLDQRRQSTSPSEHG